MYRVTVKILRANKFNFAVKICTILDLDIYISYICRILHSCRNNNIWYTCLNHALETYFNYLSMISYPEVWGALVLSKCVINYKLGYARTSWRYIRAYFENSPKKQNTPVTITSVSRILTFTSWPLTVTVRDNLSRAIKDTTLAVIIKNMWTSDHQNSICLHGRALINSLHPQPKIRIDTKLVERLKYIICEYMWI